MFDIGAMELLLVAMVALIVIGPKDLPVAMRTAGRWMGQIRGMTKHFRVGLDAMIREAEIAEQEKEWAERNAKIMAEHPEGSDADGTAPAGEDAAVMKPLDPPAGKPAASEPSAPTPDDALPDRGEREAAPDVTQSPSSAPVESESSPDPKTGPEGP